MFGLRKKEQSNLDLGSSDFREWLGFNEKYEWVANYIDDRGNIDKEKVSFDIMNGNFAIARLGEENFKHLLADLYCEFLEIERVPAAELVSADDRRLLKFINGMPVGAILRRITSRQGGNTWAASIGKRRMFYGQTLLAGLEKMIDTDEDARKKFSANEVRPRVTHIKVKKV